MAKFSFTQAILTLLVIVWIMFGVYYFLYDAKDWGFIVGFTSAFALWQINYRNHYGKWFDY